LVTSVKMQSKYGNFTLLIDEEDLCLVKKGLRLRKQRVLSGSIIYIPTASKNGFNRRNNDYRFVHLLVVEKCLNRSLHQNEVVHHIDSNRFNCTRSNLLVSKRNEHSFLHIKMGTEYAKTMFQSPLNDVQLQLLHELLGHNTQDILGIRLTV